MSNENDRIDKIAKVVDSNAQVLMVFSVALNLCLRKLGITDAEVFKSLSDETTKLLAGKPIQSSGAGPVENHSGNGRSPILDGPGSGTDSGIGNNVTPSSGGGGSVDSGEVDNGYQPFGDGKIDHHKV